MITITIKIESKNGHTFIECNGEGKPANRFEAEAGGAFQSAIEKVADVIKKDPRAIDLKSHEKHGGAQ